MTDSPPADWHPDPFGRHDYRYWDGSSWTAHVSSRGLQGEDAPVHRESPAAPGTTVSRDAERVRRQLQAVPRVSDVEDASILHEPILIVNQKAMLLSSRTEYTVLDQHGTRIGAVQEIGGRLLRRAMGAGNTGSYKFEVVDDRGRVLLALHRPAKLLKSRMLVSGQNGTHGEIVQKTIGVIGTVRFDLQASGRVVGWITADTKQAWDFTIHEVNGAVIGRITKTWAGWAKERFTAADNYVVQIDRPLHEPLRSLVLAGTLAIDTALKQGTPSTKTSYGRPRRYR